MLWVKIVLSACIGSDQVTCIQKTRNVFKSSNHFYINGSSIDSMGITSMVQVSLFLIFVRFLKNCLDLVDCNVVEWSIDKNKTKLYFRFATGN